jgi:hypothetical protein
MVAMIRRMASPAQYGKEFVAPIAVAGIHLFRFF